MADDPDPDTRAELESLINRGDVAAITDRFAAPLRFGTAGIRGPLGAGPGRMNQALVRRVSAGLAARLQAQAEAAGHGVVVGRDARHGSSAFAQDTAAVLAGAGLPVQAFDGVVPTPLLAFAVRHLGAAAGVQITASHNPPGDNGYKVYWSGGGQIFAPLDAEIAQAADAAAPVADIPLDAEGVTAVSPDVRSAYIDAVLELCRHRQARDLTIVYTPLHGVAGDLVLDVLERAGFTDVHPVPSQFAPDPDFPTVSFPNPEEPGALDHAFAHAAELDADLILANDPDGDRLAVAIPTDSGGWRALSGDEIGCLLAEYLLEQGAADDPGACVATTVVSSRMLSRIAERHGAGYDETLTGFKWLADKADTVEQSGGHMVLAYEQALGVMCGTAVRDKDGISGALVFSELAAVRKAEGSSVAAALDELAERYGVHTTVGQSVRLEGADGPALVDTVLRRLREDPPQQVGGVQVTAREDRGTARRFESDGTVTVLSTPPTELLGFELADGTRLQVRPSGTEPLLKFYIETVAPVTDDGLADARARSAAHAQHMAEAFLALAVHKA